MDDAADSLVQLRWLIEHSIDQAFMERFAYGHVVDPTDGEGRVHFPGQDSPTGPIISLNQVRHFRERGWIRFVDPAVAGPCILKIAITEEGVAAVGKHRD